MSKDPETRKEDSSGRAGGGDSGGGAYPNPHDGKKDAGKEGGFLGHGGQSDMEYHGHGQLGGDDVGGGNANAPARKKKTGDDGEDQPKE